MAAQRDGLQRQVDRVRGHPGFGQRGTRVLIKSLCGLLILADAAASRRYSFHLAAAFFLTGSALHTLLHECGHFLGGLCSGYSFCSLSIGPLNILRDSGCVRLWLQPGLPAHCQCVMIPSENTMAFVRYNLGGIAANAVLCAASVIAVWRSGGLACLFWTQLLFAGLVKLTANAVPCVKNGIPNDALTVWILSRSTENFTDYKEYLRLYHAAALGQPVHVRQQERQETNHGRTQLDMIYYLGIRRMEREYEDAGNGL